MKISQNLNRSLRGGGSFCSSVKQHSQRTKTILKIDSYLIQFLVRGTKEKCQNILDASKNIALKANMETISNNIQWFDRQQLSIHQLSQCNQLVQESIGMVQMSLELLLQSVGNLIQSQKFYAIQIMKICNAFSLLIFKNYVINRNRPMILQDQQRLLTYLTDIQISMGQGGNNDSQYEFELLQMCIEICPTNSKEECQLMWKAVIGIIYSIAEQGASVDNLIALIDGVKYCLRKYSKKRKEETFQIIFYFEQLKWAIVEQIQDDLDYNNTLIILSNNYLKVIKKSNNWIIKCSWIKLVTEVINYKPLISKFRFNKLYHKSNKSWEQAIADKIVECQFKGSLIGFIQNPRLFEFQKIILNGNYEIPKFENFILNAKEQEEKNNQKEVDQIILLQQFRDSIKINEIYEMNQQLLKKYHNYIDGYQSLEDYPKYEQSQFFISINCLLADRDKIYQLFYDYYLYGRIINQQVIRITQLNNEELNQNNEYILDKFISIVLIKHYFTILLGQRQNLLGFVEEYQEFLLFSPGSSVKSNLDSSEFTILIKKIFDQVKQNDWNQLIKLLDLQIEKLKSELKINPIQQLKKYSEQLDEFLLILFTNLRQHLIIEESQLQYFAQLIISEQEHLLEKIKKTERRKQYFYFSIISSIGTLYNQSREIFYELKLDKQQATQFKTLQVSEILKVYCNLIELDTISLFQNQYIQDPFNQNDINNFIIPLLTFNKLLNNYKNRILSSFNLLCQIKSKINVLQVRINETHTQPQLYDKLMKNKDRLDKYLLMEQIKDISNFMSIISERIEIFKQIENSQQYIINNNILEKFIKFDQILQQEVNNGPEHDKHKEIKKSQENLQNIADQLSEQYNQQSHQFEVSNQLEQIIKKIDLIVAKLRAQLAIYQVEVRNQYINSKNLMERIKLCIQNEIQNEMEQNQIEIEYQNLLDNFQSTIVLGSQFKVEIITINSENSDLILQLPSLPIPHQYIQTEVFTYINQNLFYNYENENQESQDQIIIDSLSDQQWRIKEFFYSSCLFLNLSPINKDFKDKIEQIILYGKFKETDYRVIRTLQNEKYKEQMQKVINYRWEESKAGIEAQLQQSLKKMQNIQFELQQEERKVQRKFLQQQHTDLQDQMKQQLKNLNEIRLVLSQTIPFIQDMEEKLAKIQNTLENAIYSIQNMEQDIKFLRGKSPQQLLEIRMEQVMSNKVIYDSQNVYVEIFTKEYDIQNKKEKDERTLLFDEVKNFLNEQQQQQSSLLIHGIAGSGKSISAKKIEEDLWVLYQKKVLNQSWDQIKEIFIIPIFIQLPFLKDPVWKAIEETLFSQIYQFNQNQFYQLQEIIKINNYIRFVFIMDSYDELAKKYQQINLILQNNIYKWKNQNERFSPKVITTSRSEVFTDNYQSWFYGDQNNGQLSLKEIRLISFDKKQRCIFLQQHSQLQLKLKIKEFLEIINSNQQLDCIIKSTIIIYDKTQMLINNNGNQILSESSSLIIINTIKENPNILKMDEELENLFIKQLQLLWSYKQYKSIIKQLNLKEMLETPFLMNIVVVILPEMNAKLFSQNYLEIRFHEQYQKNRILQIENIITNFVLQKLDYQKNYNQQEIQVLKQKINDRFANEIEQIWKCLINSDFFKNFSASNKCEDIIKLIQTSIEAKNDIFSITQQENRDKKNSLVIYNSLVTKTETLYGFYQEFMNNYIEKQRKKLSYDSEIDDQNRFLLDINQYAQELAIIMTKQNKTVVEIQQQGRLQNKNTNQDPYYEFFEQQDELYYYKVLIRKCIPIKQKINQFQFHHKSIQEYLVASSIIEFLSKISLDMNYNIQKIIELRNQNQMFQVFKNINDIDIRYKDFLNGLFDCHLNQDLDLSSQSMIGQMRFIKAGLQYQSNLQNTCYLLARLSSICTLFIKLSSNALYLYTQVLLNVENKNFREINIENISLDGINFTNCNFTRSQLKNVSINGINLNQCDLSNSSWIDCYSNDLPNFRSTIKSKIACICFSTSEEQIITGQENGTISLWDKKQVILLKLYMTGQPYLQLIGITHIYDNNEIQLAVFYDLQNQEYGTLLRVDFMRIKDNNTLEQIQVIQICSNNLNKDNILWSFSLNSKFFIYRNKNEMNAYDLITRETQTCKFQNQIIYFQIRDDNNLVYIIFVKFIEDVCIWNIEDNIKKKLSINKIQEFKELYFDERLNFKFSRDFQILAIQSKLDFYLFNIQANNSIKLNLQDVKVFEFSSNQKYLGLGGDYLAIFDIQNQCITQKLYGFNQSINTIIFSSNLKEIITLSKDGVVKYWDLMQCLQNTQQISSNFQHQIDQIQYSINGRLYYVLINHQVYVYDSNTGLQVDLLDIKVDMFRVILCKEELFFQQKGIWYIYNYNFKITTELKIISQQNLIISQDGKLFWTQLVDVKIIQMDDNHEVQFISKEFVGSYPCFTNDCKIIYYYDEQAEQLVSILCQQQKVNEIYRFQWENKFSLGKNVKNIQLSLDDNNIFITSGLELEMKQLFIYCIINHKRLYQMEPSGDYPYQIAPSLDNRYIFISLLSVIKILNSVTFEQIGEDLFGHSPYTKQLIVNPNGCQFITLGKDNKIKIWENNNTISQDLQNNPYYLKQTIAQKSTQIVNIHKTNMLNAKIISHLGYNIQDVWINQFSHFKFDNPYTNKTA